MLRLGMCRMGDIHSQDRGFHPGIPLNHVVEEVIMQRENRSILEALNQAYDDAPDQEDDILQKRMRRRQKQLVEGQFDSVGPLLEPCNLEP